MSEQGKRLTEYLEHDITNLNLENVGGLKFIDDFIEKLEDADRDRGHFEGTKTIGSCFEGTYTIYSLRGSVTAVGSFDKFNLSVAVDVDRNVVVLIERGEEVTNFQFGAHRLENCLMMLVELFRKEQQQCLSEIVSTTKSVVVDIDQEGVHIFSKGGDLIIAGSAVETGVKKGDFVIHDSKNRKWVKYVNQ